MYTRNLSKAIISAQILFELNLELFLKQNFYEKNTNLCRCFHSFKYFLFDLYAFFFQEVTPKIEEDTHIETLDEKKGFLFVILYLYVSGIRNVVHNLSLVRIIKITFYATLNKDFISSRILDVISKI